MVYLGPPAQDLKSGSKVLVRLQTSQGLNREDPLPRSFLWLLAKTWSLAERFGFLFSFSKALAPSWLMTRSSPPSLIFTLIFTSISLWSVHNMAAGFHQS